MADQKLKWVRSIFGDPVNAYQWYHHIPSGGINNVLATWHSKQQQRDYSICSPSRLTTCPKVIWLSQQGYQETKPMGWGVKQRLLLGRVIEDLIAKQLDDEGLLVFHWKDGKDDEVEKLKVDNPKLEGVPDILFKRDDKILLSDSKSARSDGFGYQPIDFEEWKADGFNHKYFVQLNAYFYLMHLNADKLTMPMPDQCHIFVFALDDGIVKREFTWTPTQEDMLEVERYARRYNEALVSPTMPECTCESEGVVKFCPFGDYGQAKIADTCCNVNNLRKE